MPSTESQNRNTNLVEIGPTADSLQQSQDDEHLHSLKRRRSIRSTSKTVNYHTLANGRPPRKKRLEITPRSKNPTDASRSPDIREERSEGEYNETISSGRVTQGGKSPVKMASLKKNIIKDNIHDHSERTSSLSPMPDDLEESRNSPIVFSGNGLLRNGGRFSTKVTVARKDLDRGIKGSSPTHTASKKRRCSNTDTRALKQEDADGHDDDEGDTEHDQEPVRKSRKTSGNGSSLSPGGKKKNPASSKKSQSKSPNVHRQKSTTPEKKRRSPRNLKSRDSDTKTTPMEENSEPESLDEGSLPHNSSSSTISEESATTPFVPPPITQQDKYVPYRPITNNQAIMLFDFMAARMDWHSKELFDEVGIRNMFGNRRVAAERFFKGEVRKLLISALAEAEGRMCVVDNE